MNSTNIISIFAIILSAVAIGISSTGSSNPLEGSVTKDQVREIVRQELERLGKGKEETLLEGLVSDKKPGELVKSKASTNRKVRSIVANEVQVQLEDLVQNGEIDSLLDNSSFNQEERVDVSHLETTEEKVKFILSKFDKLKSFHHDSAVLEQLREFGDEAIPFLLEGKKRVGRHWGGSWAATQALSKMLTEDHKDIILENFKKNSDFPELIQKFAFPEAEELVFKKVRSTKDYLDENIIEAALDYDPDRAEEDLREYISKGSYVSNAAEALLARDSDIDIKNELKLAALNCDEVWQKAQLSGVVISQGLNEGLGLALDAYLDSDDQYSKKEALKIIRQSTDFKGTTAELIEFVKENKDDLVWDEKLRRFK